MGVHGSAIGYRFGKISFSVRVRILLNLWDHTLTGVRFVEYWSDRSMSITHRKSFGVIKI